MKHIFFCTIFLSFIVSRRNLDRKAEKNAAGLLVLNFEAQYPSSFFADRIFEKIEMIPLETTNDGLVRISYDRRWPGRNYFYQLPPLARKRGGAKVAK